MLYFSLGFGSEHDLVTTGLGFEAKNHDLGLGLGLVDVALNRPWPHALTAWLTSLVSIAVFA